MESDPLIALGILGGSLLILAGVALRVDYGAVRAEYEGWLRSRNRAVTKGAAARLALAQIFAGLVFAISAAVGVWVY